MLVYNDGSFIQILEGDENVVKSLYKTIENDSRHETFLMDSIEINERTFSSWDMAFRKISVLDLNKFPSLETHLHVQKFSPS